MNNELPPSEEATDSQIAENTPTEAEESEKSRNRIEEEERKLWRQRGVVTLVLAVGSPILILVMVIEAVLVLKLGFPWSPWAATRTDMQNETSLTGLLAQTFGLWAATAVVAGTVFTFAFSRPLHLIQEKLDWERRKARFHSSYRTKFLQEEIKRITNRLVRVFALSSEKIDKEINNKLEIANQTLELWEKRGDGKAYVDIETSAGKKRRCDLTDVEEALSAAEGAIYREEREQREQQLWRNTSTGVVAFYFVLLGLLFAYNSPTVSSETSQSPTTPVPISVNAPQSAVQKAPAETSQGESGEVPEPLINKPNELFGIPLSVVAWSALGSIAAILFKLYVTDGRVNFQNELRWLIARPLIGIIMGSLVYLTIVASVLVIGEYSEESSALNSRRQLAILWIFAFIGGFSEKFYMGIISVLVKKSGDAQTSPYRPDHDQKSFKTSADSTQIVVTDKM